jgi:hypothetical protein
MAAVNLAGREQWIDFRGVPSNWDTFYATAKRRGIVGAIRYIDAGSDSKQIHSAERQAANRQGIKLLLVDELNTGDAWDAANDFAAGVARGKGALADAKREGFGSIGISAAADAHAPSTRHINDAVAYARGFASVVGKSNAGFYGFSEVLRGVRAANVVSWYWLAGSKPSAEDAKWLAFWQDNTGFIDVGGVTCDRNWRLDGPIPGYATEEDELTAEQWKKLTDELAFQRRVAVESQRRVTLTRAEQAAQASALMKAIASSGGADFDPEAFRAVMEESAQKAMTESMDELRAMLEDIVRDVVPEEQADNIIEKLGEKLRSQGETV